MTYYDVVKADVVVVLAKTIFDLSEDEYVKDAGHKAKIEHAIAFVENCPELVAALEKYR